MIPNPTPITPQPFNGLWLRNVTIQLGADFISIEAIPYNGQQALVSPVARYRGALDVPLKSRILNEIRRVALEPAMQLVRLTVTAPSPDMPVMIAAHRAESSAYVIRDAYALAAQDPAFAQAFVEIMTDLGTKIVTHISSQP